MPRGGAAELTSNSRIRRLFPSFTRTRLSTISLDEAVAAWVAHAGGLPAETALSIEQVLTSQPENRDLRGEVGRFLTQVAAADGLTARQTPLLLLLARFHMAPNQIAQAIAVYDRTLELDPNSATVLNNLAYAEAFSDDRRELALQHIDRAIANDGPRRQYLDTRAMVLLQLGRSEEARREREHLPRWCTPRCTVCTWRWLNTGSTIRTWRSRRCDRGVSRGSTRRNFTRWSSRGSTRCARCMSRWGRAWRRANRDAAGDRMGSGRPLRAYSHPLPSRPVGLDQMWLRGVFVWRYAHRRGTWVLASIGASFRVEARTAKRRVDAIWPIARNKATLASVASLSACFRADANGGWPNVGPPCCCESA